MKKLTYFALLILSLVFVACNNTPTQTPIVNMESILTTLTNERIDSVPASVGNILYGIETDSSYILAISYYISPIDGCVTYRDSHGHTATVCEHWNIHTIITGDLKHP